MRLTNDATARRPTVEFWLLLRIAWGNWGIGQPKALK